MNPAKIVALALQAVAGVIEEVVRKKKSESCRRGGSGSDSGDESEPFFFSGREASEGRFLLLGERRQRLFSDPVPPGRSNSAGVE